MIRKLFAVLALAICTSGCGALLDIDLFVVGEKTALESQVLGTYEALGRDLTSYASVRGVEPDGSLIVPPPMTESQQAVMQALNNQKYNQDDIQRLLGEGIVGESNEALLVLREETPRALDDLTPQLIRTVVDEENRDRGIVLDRLVRTTPGITEDQRGEVVWIYATLNHDLAPAGAWIQTREGQWRQK